MPMVRTTRGEYTGQIQKVLDLAESAGVLRPRDLGAYGILRHYLARLVA